MTYLMSRVEVDDYDAWKPMFDADPAGARRDAKGHRLFRGVEDPNEVSIAVEFESADDARQARERLMSSGVLDRINIKVEPTIVEEADVATY